MRNNLSLLWIQRMLKTVNHLFIKRIFTFDLFIEIFIWFEVRKKFCLKFLKITFGKFDLIWINEILFIYRWKIFYFIYLEYLTKYITFCLLFDHSSQWIIVKKSRYQMTFWWIVFALLTLLKIDSLTLSIVINFQFAFSRYIII